MLFELVVVYSDNKLIVLVMVIDDVLFEGYFDVVIVVFEDLVEKVDVVRV